MSAISIRKQSCFFLAALSILSACGTPVPDISSDLGKQMILDEVDKALSTEDCATAVELIAPLYASQYSDNVVRMKAASAYGCHAKINFFTLTSNIVSNSTALASSKFWNTMAKFFPSTSGSDYVVEGAIFSQDALMAVLETGALVLPLYQINTGSYNVGSVFANDRTDDSNLYMVMASMAGIGSLGSRYGSPVSGTYARGALLPWTTATAVTTDGCSYASSLLNFVDSIDAIKTAVPTSLASTLSSISTTFKTAFNTACDAGCKGTASGSVPAGYNTQGNWVATGCAITAGCSTCPSVLRNRNKCTAVATDEASCAAAGLANMVNSSILGWQ